MPNNNNNNNNNDNDNDNDNEKLDSFPLLPSHAAYALHGFAVAVTDTVREEVSGDIARRTLHKINALATAQELIAKELAHFFGSRMGDDHDQLEAIEDRYLEAKE